MTLETQNAGLTDLYYDDQYKKVHAQRKFETSGIEFLPEASLYFLNALATGSLQIRRGMPLRVLDYGCGDSTLLQGLQFVMRPVFNYICSGEYKATNFHANFFNAHTAYLMMKQTSDLDKLVTADFSDMNHLIQVSRFDPAIPEYAKMPKGPFDMVLCTDVMEHIPVEATDRSGHQPLANTIAYLNTLSDNVFLNVSCRQAINPMPDGSTAHCTVKPALWWKNYLTSRMDHLHPVLSRDLTSALFVKSRKGILPEATDAAYELLGDLGEIDLIPAKLSEKKQEAYAKVPGKLENLAEIQSSKPGVIADCSKYWVLQDPSAVQRKPYKQTMLKHDIHL